MYVTYQKLYTIGCFVRYDYTRKQQGHYGSMAGTKWSMQPMQYFH